MPDDRNPLTEFWIEQMAFSRGAGSAGWWLTALCDRRSNELCKRGSESPYFHRFVSSLAVLARRVLHLIDNVKWRRLCLLGLREDMIRMLLLWLCLRLPGDCRVCLRSTMGDSDYCTRLRLQKKHRLLHQNTEFVLG